MLGLEYGFNAVFVGRIEVVAERGVEVVFAFAHEQPECVGSLFPFTLEYEGLAMEAEGCATGGVTYFSGSESALLRQVPDSIAEIFGDVVVNLLYRRAAFAFGFFSRVETVEKYDTAIELYKLEVEVAAEEAGLGYELTAHFLIDDYVCVCDTVDCHVAVEYGFVAILVEVARRAVLLAVGHVFHELAVARFLGGIALPGVVGGHFHLEPGVVDLPPVVAGYEVVAAVHEVAAFLFGGEIYVEFLLTACGLVEEVVARTHQHSSTDGCQY